MIAILPSNSLAPTSSSATQIDLPMFWFWFEEGDVVDDVQLRLFFPPRWEPFSFGPSITISIYYLLFTWHYLLLLLLFNYFVDDVELRVETLLPPEVGALADN